MQWLREYRARRKAHKIMSKHGWSPAEINDWVDGMKGAKQQLDENVQLLRTLEAVRDGNATRELKANISLGLIEKSGVTREVKLEFIGWVEQEYKDLLSDEVVRAKES